MILKRVSVYAEPVNNPHQLQSEREVLKNVSVIFNLNDNAEKIINGAVIEVSRNHHLLLARKHKQVYVFARGRDCCYHLLKTPGPVKDYKVNAEGLLLRLYDEHNKIGLYYFDAEWKLSLLRDNYVSAGVDHLDVVRVQDDDDYVKSKRTLLQYDRFMRRFIVKGTERL